jgi:hypothetical protein
MDSIVKERRRTSHRGLLESAIQNTTKLASINDPGTRMLANKVMTDLVQLRRELPTRREFDTKPPRKDA